jgi:3-hydroxybutyryl-CoA dehydratase
MHNKLTIGAKASLSKTITEDDVRTFADVSGDHNPLHLDEAYAKTTRFGARIAHGAFSVALISAVLGTQLPGPGSIHLGHSLKFVQPVYLGDTVTVTVEITAIRADKGIITLKTVCANQRGEIVVEGEAVVMHEDAKSR